MLKVNRELFPVKMHYFFFMAAMGPILPFYPLVGKQLGLSEAALGSMTAVFPLLYLLLKPFVGFLADFFYRRRKLMFLTFILATCLSFDMLATIHDSVSLVTCRHISLCTIATNTTGELCKAKCGGRSSVVNLYQFTDRSVCIEQSSATDDNPVCCLGQNSSTVTDPCSFEVCILECPSSQFYLSRNFWIFTIFTSVGCIFFNITNFFSDAICFDVLGEGNDKSYGLQRVWGTIGFGMTALVGGYTIDLASHDLPYHNFVPAFVLATICISLDLFFSTKLELPGMCKSENIVKDVWSVVSRPRVTFFLTFATFIGILDSSIFYYLLWYMEDLSEQTGGTSDIKLLQGLTVAVEALVGETASFFMSGWVLRKVGYGHSLSLGLLFYSLRLGLLACITEPWHAVPIEALLQGPSYALLYSTIVAYASSVTPPGTSATIQGLVAGMDDGLGISVGSVVGGFVYSYYGGRALYTSYAVTAFICALTHFTLYIVFFHNSPENISPESSKTYRLAKSEVEMVTFESPMKITS